LPAVDDRGIVTEAANVNAHNDDLTKGRLNLPRRRFVGERLRDERDRVDTRELPLDADAEEVRVFPVILFPPLDLRLVCDGDLPRVDRGRPPPMREGSTGEALPEAAAVPRRVPADGPNDLRVL